MSEGNYNALLRQLIQPSEIITRPLLRTEAEISKLENALLETVSLRRATLHGADVAAYASQIGKRLDGNKYTLGDVRSALDEIAGEARGEFETTMPSLGELLERVEKHRRIRTKPEAEEACNARLDSYRLNAERIRQEREDQWKSKRAAKKVAS